MLPRKVNRFNPSARRRDSREKAQKAQDRNSFLRILSLFAAILLPSRAPVPFSEWYAVSIVVKQGRAGSPLPAAARKERAPCRQRLPHCQGRSKVVAAFGRKPLNFPIPSGLAATLEQPYPLP